jgi:hypothetical protein
MGMCARTAAENQCAEASYGTAASRINPAFAHALRLLPLLPLSSCHPAAAIISCILLLSSVLLLLLLLLPGTMSHMPPELLRYGRMSPAVSFILHYIAYSAPLN